MRRTEVGSETSGQAGRSRCALRAVGATAIACLLLLTVLDVPTRPYDLDHDLSSSAAFEYFAARGVQFGTELIQNVGPLGWAQYSSVYAGFLPEAKLVLALLRALALCGLALWACTRFRSPLARGLWLLAFVALIPLYPIGDEHEVDFGVSEDWTYLCAYLSSLALLSLPRGREGYAVLPSFFLAFLALIKHTFLFVTLLGVGSAVQGRLRRRELRSGLLLALLYAGFVALLWAGSGQHLANLPAYGLGAFRFTSGYNEAMALPADAVSTTLGCATLAGLAGLILGRTLGRSQSPAKSLVDAGFLFVVWKHGFVRGDPAHVAIFFHTSMFLVLLFGFAVERPGEAEAPQLPPSSRPRTALALFTLLAIALGLYTSITDAHYQPARLATLWQRNLEWLITPGQRSVELSQALMDRESEFRLPGLNDAVGSAAIDAFGYRPGWALLNHLAYTPRPMPISFAATNEFLLRRNEAFYRDPEHAPRFILCELGSIDDRLVSLDDGLALGAILDNYHPRMTWGAPEGDARRQQDMPLLLERNPVTHTRKHAERTLLAATEIGFGETLSLEPFGETWLWLEVEIEPSLLGRLRALLLRSAALEMALDVAGHEPPAVRRYVASMGATGFLISPLLETNRELFAAYAAEGSAEPLQRVRSLRFEHAQQDGVFFDSRIRTRLYAGSPPGGRSASLAHAGDR